MYNQIYNQDVFNFTILSVIDSIEDDIRYNGLGLQNDFIRINKWDWDNFAEINLSTFSNPVVDGGGVLNRQYSKKQITFRWTMVANTASDLNDLIDLFKLKTSAVEWFLDIKVNGKYRRTRATVVNSVVFDRNHYNITFVPFEITFETQDPFMFLIDNNTVSEFGLQNNSSIEFTYLGNAVSSPKIYVGFTAAASMDEFSLELNNRIITIDESISSGDLLILDGVEKSVILDGVEVDYSGIFPTITNWSNIAKFTGDWTFTADIIILYRENYL